MSDRNGVRGESPNDSRPPSPVEVGGQPEQEELEMEWDVDRLIAVLGPYFEWRSDPLDPAMAPFYRWLAREARDRQSEAERVRTEVRAERFARTVQARIALERAVLAYSLEGAPPVRAAADEEMLGQYFDLSPQAGQAPWPEPRIAAGLGREAWDEPVERFVQVPDGLPRNARYLALTVAGDSMTPLIHSDDVVLVKLGRELARDAIVVAWHPDHGYVVKCVGDLSGDGVELLSVNPEFPPITIPRQPSLILGTVLARWCAHEGAGERETSA